MDPQAIATLKASQEGRQLVGYLASLIEELDSVAGIQFSTGEMYAVEVRARLLAIEKLKTALATLLDVHPTTSTDSRPDEYVT